MATSGPKFSVETEFTSLQIAELLCCAFEGGSNYWIDHIDYSEPSDISLEIDGDEWPRYCIYPLRVDGAVKIYVDPDDDPPKRDLNIDSLRSGLRIMHEKYAQHFSDFLSGDSDATTGDVFLQCCIFDELVYG